VKMNSGTSVQQTVMFSYQMSRFRTTGSQSSQMQTADASWSNVSVRLWRGSVLTF